MDSNEQIVEVVEAVEITAEKPKRGRKKKLPNGFHTRFKKGEMPPCGKQFKKGEMPPCGNPWKKGESPNPGGQPALPSEVKKILREATPQAAQKVVELMSCGIPKVELAAAQEILNRALGKPKENISIVDLMDGGDMRVQIRQIMLQRMSGKIQNVGQEEQLQLTTGE